MNHTFRHQSLQKSPSHWFSTTESRLPHLAKTAQSAARFLPPQVLFLLAMLSVQLGAAFSKSLFQPLGSIGTVYLRVTFAAIIFLLVWRPRISGYTRSTYILIALFGLSIAGMNSFFYASIARLPLGIAITLEFVGPLGVALTSSRRMRDVLWTLFAVAGVVLLAPIHGAMIDPLGVAFALAAGGCWAAYILLNVRVGRVFSDGAGLALGMSVASLILVPFGLPSLGAVWHTPSLLFVGFSVAILSSVIPFSLEMVVLRHISAHLFGVLSSLEPVIGALIGFIVLGEAVGLRALLAMALIVIASGGVSLDGKRKKPHTTNSGKEKSL